MGFNINLYIFGGLLLLGFLFMGGASILDVQYGHDKYSTLFYSGLGAVFLGAILKVTGHGD